MPTLTINISDHDLAMLDRIGDELGLNARVMAERLVHRTLARTVGPRPVTHKQRSSDRALRQLELLRIMRRRRIDTFGQLEKRALAKRFGVAERTIYRDLEILERSRSIDAAKVAQRTAPDHPTDGATDDPSGAALAVALA